MAGPTSRPEVRYYARWLAAPAARPGAGARGQQGEVLSGTRRYEIHAPLASGGMATVYLGRSIGSAGFARAVAIKRLHEHYVSDPEFVSMFLDEALLVGRLHHANIVPTLDVVVERGQLLIVMELVAGETLARLRKASTRSGAPLSLALAAGIAGGMLGGLHAAHEAAGRDGEPLGIVHRDVSPQNVIVGIDGVARMLDFGVAKAAGRLRTTADGSTRGKFAYMAPEQVRGEKVDRRCDVYAASVVLWEMLAGRRLFMADNEGALVEQVLRGALEAPSAAAPGVSPALDAIVMRGLALVPEARFASAREMALAIEEAVKPATAAHVGAWVEEVAGPALRERAKLVREVEGSTTGDAAEARRVVAEISAPPSDGATVSAGLPVRGRRRRLVSWLVGAAASGLGVFALLYVHAARPAAAPVPSSPVSTAYSAAALAASSPPAPAPAEPSAPSAKSTAASRVVPAPSKSAPDCTPPFTVDELGRKIWKERCLH